MVERSSPGPLFDDGKAEGAMRTIGEVSAAFGIKAHVLRYWEQQFPSLQPLKRSGGRRLYRAEDVAMVETINRLVNEEGYTLKGAKKAIAADGSGATTAVTQTSAEITRDPSASTAKPPPEVTEKLRAIRNRLAAALD